MYRTNFVFTILRIYLHQHDVHGRNQHAPMLQYLPNPILPIPVTSLSRLLNANVNSVFASELFFLCNFTFNNATNKPSPHSLFQICTKRTCVSQTFEDYNKTRYSSCLLLYTTVEPKSVCIYQLNAFAMLFCISNVLFIGSSGLNMFLKYHSCLAQIILKLYTSVYTVIVFCVVFFVFVVGAFICFVCFRFLNSLTGVNIRPTADQLNIYYLVIVLTGGYVCLIISKSLRTRNTEMSRKIPKHSGRDRTFAKCPLSVTSFFPSITVVRRYSLGFFKITKAKELERKSICNQRSLGRRCKVIATLDVGIRKKRLPKHTLEVLISRKTSFFNKKSQNQKSSHVLMVKNNG